MSTYEANRYSFPTSAITSGTFADARFAASNITQHVTNTTEASGGWSLTPIVGSMTVHSGKYVRIGKLVSLTAWGKGGGNPAYPSQFNTNRFYFTGAPITSMNTGTASDCVGFGTICLKGSHNSMGTHQVWILSNSTQIRVGKVGSNRLKAADSNHTSSNTNSGMENAEFNANWANANGDLENNDNSHWAMQMHYYVD